MPPAAVTGGKPKKSKSLKKQSTKKPAKMSVKKPTKKSTKSKKPAKSEAPTMEKLKKEAKRLKVPLSKDGKTRNKASLAAAIAYRKKH